MTSFSTRIARVITAMGGRVGKTVHGRNALSAVTGVCAITLAFGLAARASASPPLGEDVTGTSAITLQMGVAGEGLHTAPVTGTAAVTLSFAVEGHGLAFAPVTGTSAITLDLGVSGVGDVQALPGVSGAGAITLSMAVAAAGTHTPLVTGAGSIVLPLSVAGAGSFYPMVTGTSAIALTMGVAGAGSAQSDLPLSVSAPVVGTPLPHVYALSDAGATGPRTSPTNGTWAGALDAYLIGKGFVIGNDNGALFLDIGSATVTISNYKFLNCPRVQYRGTGTLNWDDCTFDSDDVGGVSGPRDINGNPTGENITVNFNYPHFNRTTQYADTGVCNMYNPRLSNQKQTIWGTGGATYLIQDFYCTGGGCDPPAGAHVELIQFNADIPHNITFRRGRFNFIDGQATLPPTVPNFGWTAVVTAPGTGSIIFEDVIVTGVDEVNANPINPDRIGYIISYWNAQVTNCVLQRGCFGYSTGVPAGLSVSGNRTFSNVALTAADFG